MHVIPPPPPQGVLEKEDASGEGRNKGWEKQLLPRNLVHVISSTVSVHLLTFTCNK